MPPSMPADPRLQQQVTPLDPGDPVAQTLQVMQMQGQLPAQSPAQMHLGPDAHVQGLMQNLLHNTLASGDSSIPMQALAAIMDIMDAPKHGVQSMMGTDQDQMDAAFEELARKAPAPRTSDILMGPAGISRYMQELGARGETDRRWSPELTKILGNVATDPTTYMGVGLFKGLAKGAAVAGAPKAVRGALKSAQIGDEFAAQGLTAAADKIVGVIQSGLLGKVNEGLAKAIPSLPKWTEYAKKTAGMNDALQELEHRGMDFSQAQAALSQGMSLDDLYGALSKTNQARVDKAELGKVLGAKTIADRGAAYELYKKTLLKDMGLSNPNAAQNTLQHVTEWWKQQALASISYLEQNAKGGVLGGLLSTGPGGAARMAADLFDNAGNIIRGKPFNTEAAQELSKAANVPIPASLHEMADRALNAQGGEAGKRLFGSLAGDVIGGAALGAGSAASTDQNPAIGALLGGATLGVLPKVSMRLRKSAQGVETVLRERGWVEGMSKAWARDLLDFNDEVVRILTAPGATGNTASATRTMTGGGTTTILPQAARTIQTGAARTPITQGAGLAGKGIAELHHSTDATTALGLIQNSSPDALKGLRAATVPVTRLGPNASGSPVDIILANTDQITASRLAGQTTAYRITGAGLPPQELIREVTIRNPRDVDPRLLAQFDGLGWNKTQLRGSVTYTNSNFQPWSSQVAQMPGTPMQTLIQPGQITTQTQVKSNAPVPQNILDQVSEMIGGGANADQLRQLLRTQTRVTPDRIEEAARVLDDGLYAASRQGVGVSNEFNFDYQDLSPVERAITQVAPFATWYLKAVPYFTKQGIRHPVLASLITEEGRASSEMREERGLPTRFTGTIPNQAQGSLISMMVGRPLQAFQNPLASLLPFSGLERSINNAAYDDEDADPFMKVAKIALEQIGLNPLAASVLRTAGLGMYTMDDPSNPNFLRWGAPLAGATALASRGVEAVTGQNPGWNVDLNAGFRKGEEAVREAGDAMAHGGQGRQVQDTTQLAIERRVDELALKATGGPIGRENAASIPYIQAKVAKSGPIWEQARNEIAQEKGAQSLIGFVSQTARPDAVLSPEEATIRGAKAGPLVKGEIAHALDQAAEKAPDAPADPKALAAIQVAVQTIAERSGSPTPEIVTQRLASPTNANLDWISKEVYKWEVEQEPLLRGYGSSGSMEQRRIANEIAGMGVAGSGLDGRTQVEMIAANRAAAAKQGKPTNTISAAMRIPGQEREAIKQSDPLLQEYLAWRTTHPGKELPDFLKEKYKK